MGSLNIIYKRNINCNFHQTLFYITIGILQLAKIFFQTSNLPFVATSAFFSFPENKAQQRKLQNFINQKGILTFKYLKLVAKVDQQA